MRVHFPGIFGVPIHTVAAALASAISDFITKFETSTVTQIYLVDIIPDNILLIQGEMDNLYIVSMEEQYCGIGSSVPQSRLTSHQQCAICLEAIKDCKTLPECQHSFCRECVDQSFRTGKKECPMCRKEYE